MRIIKSSIVVSLTVASAAVLLWTFLLPRLLQREMHARLARAGYGDARFTVGGVSLDRVELLDVTLAQGLELGDVDIESGPYGLWRGQPTDVVLHHPRIAQVAATGHMSARLPVRNLFIDDGEIETRGERLDVNGSIDLRGSTKRLALTAHAGSMSLGATRIDELTATIRGPMTDLQICGTGRVDMLKLDTCLHLRGSRIEEGVARIEGSAEIAHVAISDATARARFAGDLSTRTFEIHGDLRARHASRSSFGIDNAHLPFDITLAIDDAGVHLSSAPLVLDAAASVQPPSGGPIRISAVHVTARGATRIGGVDLVAGQPADGLELVADGRGISLDRVLVAATSNRARGAGILDGHLTLTLDDDELTLDSGTLTARAPGHLAIAALAIKTADLTHALEGRVLNALADFNYSRLVVTFGHEPDLHLALQGRGRRAPVSLAIDINVNGLIARNERTR